jgi:hypothetical protein
MPRSKQTSPKVAEKAAKVLASDKTGKNSKTAAGSALTQTKTTAESTARWQDFQGFEERSRVGTVPNQVEEEVAPWRRFSTAFVVTQAHFHNATH